MLLSELLFASVASVVGVLADVCVAGGCWLLALLLFLELEAAVLAEEDWAADGAPGLALAVLLACAELEASVDDKASPGARFTAPPLAVASC